MWHGIGCVLTSLQVFPFRPCVVRSSEHTLVVMVLVHKSESREHNNYTVLSISISYSSCLGEIPIKWHLWSFVIICCDAIWISVVDLNVLLFFSAYAIHQVGETESVVQSYRWRSQNKAESRSWWRWPSKNSLTCSPTLRPSQGESSLLGRSMRRPCARDTWLTQACSISSEAHLS